MHSKRRSYRVYNRARVSDRDVISLSPSFSYGGGTPGITSTMTVLENNSDQKEVVICTGKIHRYLIYDQRCSISYPRKFFMSRHLSCAFKSPVITATSIEHAFLG